MATHKRQKIASKGINTEIVPNQVTDTINIDDSNIDACSANIKSAYDALSEVSTALTNTLNGVDKKYFRGKTYDQLEAIKKYVLNQAKYADSRSQALSTQIKSDKDDMNTIVNSTKFLGEIDAVLKDTTVSASVVGLVGAMRSNYVSNIASTTGFQINEDGTLTKGNTTYAVKNGQMSVVKNNEPTVDTNVDSNVDMGSKEQLAGDNSEQSVQK